MDSGSKRLISVTAEPIEPEVCESRCQEKPKLEYPYRKPTPVGELSILRGVGEPSLRN